MSLFSQIGIIIILATILGIVARNFRQPAIVGYLLIGLLIGPIGFKIISNQEIIDPLATFGVSFLLFLIGLQLDWRKIKDLGITIFLIAIGQIILTFIAGFLLGNFLGFNLIASIYIGLGLTFASTIVVVQILSQEMTIDHLYGRIAIGILLIQDFVAILALIFLENANMRIDYTLPFAVMLSAAKLIAIMGLSWMVNKYFFSYLFRKIAKFQELPFLLSLSWCFALAILAKTLGLSIEIGSFLAGVGLATSKFNLDIITKVKSLKDFFLVIFFVGLGISTPIITGTGFVYVIIFSLFILLIHPLVIQIIMGIMNFKRHTGLFVGLSLAQISEFSLILLALGVKLGHIDSDLLGVMTLTAIITITVSSYLMIHNQSIYNVLGDALKIFERKNTMKETSLIIDKNFVNHAIIIGARRTGYHILHTLKKLKQKIVVVDFNPEIAEEFAGKKIPIIYGDATDNEIIRHLNIKSAKMLISTIPNYLDNISILKKVKKINCNLVVYVMAFDVDEALELYKHHADYVILPQHISGEHVAYLLNQIKLDEKKLLDKKLRHIEQLHNYYKLHGLRD